jgi:CheY-like chemotaxis protein
MSDDEDLDKIKRTFALKETELNSQIKLLKMEIEKFRATIENLELANKNISDECNELKKSVFQSQNQTQENSSSSPELEILRRDMLRYKVAYEKTEAKNKELLKRVSGTSSIQSGEEQTTGNPAILEENEYLKTQLKESRTALNKSTTESEHLRNKFEELSRIFLDKDKEIDYLSKEIMRQKEIAKSFEKELQNSTISLKKKVLIADDSLIIRSIQKNILESIGFDVVLAKDILEAKNNLEKTSFDLAIIDITLNESLDGLEIAKNLKEKNDKTPFLFMLSNKDELINDISEMKPLNIVYKDSFKQDRFIETVQSAFTLKFS